VTTRYVLVLLALAACGKGDKAASGSGEASGSGSSGSSGTAETPPPTGSGSAPATFAQTISSAGVGPLNASTDPKTIGSLFPGLDAKTEHNEGEDHSADTTLLSQNGTVVLDVVVDNIRSDKDIFRIDVLGSRFATAAGIRIGSTVADFVSAYPDGSCKRETYTANAESFDKALMCEAPAVPNVAFYLDEKEFPGPDGKIAAAKIAGLKFKRIIWLSPKHGGGTGGGTGGSTPVANVPAGQPFCFEPGAEVMVDRIVATDDAATFCATVAGKLQCITASLSTGELTTAGKTPDKPAAEASIVTSSDGTKKLRRTAKGIEIQDAKTNRVLETLTPGDGAFKCVDGARYLGDEILVTVGMCDQPRAAGFLFDGEGKQLGPKIDGINMADTRAFRIKGARYAIHSADSEKVLILDAATGDAGLVELLTPAQVKACCEVKAGASVPPFALTPKGKLVSIGAALSVIDLGTGKPEHAWLLPTCKK
jgi:uncharacterized protein DUF1131